MGFYLQMRNTKGDKSEGGKDKGKEERKLDDDVDGETETMLEALTGKNRPQCGKSASAGSTLMLNYLNQETAQTCGKNAIATKDATFTAWLMRMIIDRWQCGLPCLINARYNRENSRHISS
uniref:Uncharacterized protein n=1 Tax=Romanomermis culicivorax TaxID=13658 RepID=A0A915KGJ9_ROMCU